ncbi:metallophosphoesterase [Marinospirillum sp.]|uniref:metallophosphoesterase n=1 Tax=Marinospirillum sp. TaxID=2183934 RepID=UPI00286FE23C|nr:metallophosphoesterase [Marinospirillum sp.]MDR9467523.1 metallophosphoesterase [Marinospirillum sp.]
MTKPLRLLQLTDLHLLADPQARFKGVDTRAQLLRALQEARHLAPDLLLLTGDLAQDEKLGSYEWLVTQLQNTGLPWHWLPGNHDDPELMARFAPAVFYQQLQGWQLLGLNTRWPGHAAGQLLEGELQRLDEALSADMPLLIALHHHPLAVGSRWMDAIALQNSEDFWQRLQSYPHPVVVICGHVHQEQSWQQQGVNVYSTPATALQFAPGQDVFQLDEQASPGLRWIDLAPQGHWKTGVHRF